MLVRDDMAAVWHWYGYLLLFDQAFRIFGKIMVIHFRVAGMPESKKLQ